MGILELGFKAGGKIVIVPESYIELCLYYWPIEDLRPLNG